MNTAAIQDPKIIIAEKSKFSRARMARALAEKGCSVETTGSAAWLMENLLRGGMSIVVLGDGLEEGLSVTSLIPLLKSCSTRSKIILVADNVWPTEEASVRQQGLFYRINRPACALGWSELQLAVDCARSKLMLATVTPH